MAEIDYEQAVQTLRRVVGPRYEGLEADGRDTMVEALQRELGYSGHQADEVLDAMLAAGTLRYRRGSVAGTEADREAGAAPAVLPAVPGIAGTGASGSFGAAPVAPIALGAGYWQIGADDSESTGRAGQVTPS